MMRLLKKVFMSKIYDITKGKPRVLALFLK